MKKWAVPGTWLGVICIGFSSCAPIPTPSAPSPVPASALPAPSATSAPSGRILWVTSKEDSGAGTLREALSEVQAGDTIQFDQGVFPPDSPSVVSIASQLPPLTQGNVTLDASEAGVILDGTAAGGEWTPGIVIASASNTVRGLQIINFTGAAIKLESDASHNVIGGDAGTGSGPLGQGNLLGGGGHGVALFGADDNEIKGNIIGTDLPGTGALPNRYSGILLQEGAENNVIGPLNTVAFSGQPAIEIPSTDSVHNTITRNSLHDNWSEIRYVPGHPFVPPAPTILAFGLPSGSVQGVTCPDCIVEVFSGEGLNAEVFEGSVTADANGWFALEKNSPLTGPSLRATATARDGSTSVLSVPTNGTRAARALQEGNELPARQLKPVKATNNRISTGTEPKLCPRDIYDRCLDEMIGLGVTRLRLSFNEIEVPFDPGLPELSIDPRDDAWLDKIISKGIDVTYILSFWDKAYQASGASLDCPRFKKADEIQRYLEYVRYVVRHFGERVRSYEIWNEPNTNACPQAVEDRDYVELVRRTAPVIHAEAPGAEVIVGGVTWLHDSTSQDYLFKILGSDVMPMVDGISWHPFYGASPQYPDVAAYYNRYPSLIERIRKVAAEAGFKGEYRADELTWRTPLNEIADHPWVYSEVVAAKYYARSMVLHLGVDVDAGIMVDARFSIIPKVVANVAAAMDRAKPTELAVDVVDAPADLRTYTFAVSDSEKLIALWTDGTAGEEAPSSQVTLKVAERAGWHAVAADVLYGYQQPLISEAAGSTLLIPDVLVRDYPIILRIVR